MNRGLQRFSGPHRPGQFPWSRRIHAIGTADNRPLPCPALLGFLYLATDIHSGTLYECAIADGSNLYSSQASASAAATAPAGTAGWIQVAAASFNELTGGEVLVGQFGSSSTGSRLTTVPINATATFMYLRQRLAFGIVATAWAQPSVTELSEGTTGTGAVVRATSPALTTPTLAGTPAVDDNTLAVADTAFVIGQASSSTPLVDGTAAIGTSKRYARADHVHPTDTTRAPTASPTFTGDVGGLDRLKGAGVLAPTVAVTGFGASPTVALFGGSSDSNGCIVITAGTTPGASGTITITFSSAYGTHQPTFIAMLQYGNGGAWNARATVIGDNSTSNTAAKLNWDNNGVNLIVGNQYQINYIVFGH